MMQNENETDPSRVYADGRAYKVGQDSAGRWLAMDVGGRGGGMFATREAAMRFAGAETGWRAGAVREPDIPVAFA